MSVIAEGYDELNKHKIFLSKAEVVSNTNIDDIVPIPYWERYNNFVISRTPYRISFFGGGTDYPAWYGEHKGAVLSTSIDKYCYLMCRWMPPFFPHKHRIIWSQIELCDEINEIQHPAVKGIMKYLNIRDGLELHHAGDLPARTGIGSSSSFVVGLLYALKTLQGFVYHEKLSLAREAIYIEQDALKENVGAQDQVAAAIGGFNKIEFEGRRATRLSPDKITITPIKTERLPELENHLMLFFTGFSRFATQLAKVYTISARMQKEALSEMYAMVDIGKGILEGSNNIMEFGKLLGEAWKVKQSLSKRISTNFVDYVYETAIKAGAIGGKLCGAGGGGFLLLFVEPEKQGLVHEALHSLVQVPFRFENEGAKILLGK